MFLIVSCAGSVVFISIKKRQARVALYLGDHKKRVVVVILPFKKLLLHYQGIQ